MPDAGLDDRSIVESWHANAAAWTRAVRSNAIDSRRLVTDQAILDAIDAHEPHSVLDLGCGEGWLARALHARGVEVTGVDATPELIDGARAAGGGRFQVCDYEALDYDVVGRRFDLVVANFALLGRESVEHVFRAVPALLEARGALIVQTLHPVTSCPSDVYRDGWHPGSWSGFGSDFVTPPPWYFRTLGSWIRLFIDHGFRLTDLREPTHPQTGQPASLILSGQPVTGDSPA